MDFNGFSLHVTAGMEPEHSRGIKDNGGKSFKGGNGVLMEIYRLKLGSRCGGRGGAGEEEEGEEEGEEEDNNRRNVNDSSSTNNNDPHPHHQANMEGPSPPPIPPTPAAARSSLISSNRTSTSPTKQVWTLQEWCRKATLRALTLHRINKINELPIPWALKRYVGTFSVPEDFDTDGFHMTYNFHFPNHPHHKNHRVHPARSLVDQSKVLIKVENINATGCSVCAVGEPPQVNQQALLPPPHHYHHQESDHWALVNHSNIQRCFMKMTNEHCGKGIMCYVLEYPLINLKDLILRLSLTGTYIPEFLIWDTIYRLSSAFLYLDGLQLYSNELCEPQNFVLMADGQVKVENLLLYLPTQANLRSVRGSMTRQKKAIYSAPESWIFDQQFSGSTPNTNNEALTVWTLGCVFYELASLCPAFMLETCAMKVSIIPTTAGLTSMHHVVASSTTTQAPPGLGLRFRPQTPPPLPAAYSHQLGNLIGSCLREFSEDRPGLSQIMQVAAFNVEHLRPSYYGPRSLLHLIPDIPMDD